MRLDKYRKINILKLCSLLDNKDECDNSQFCKWTNENNCKVKLNKTNIKDRYSLGRKKRNNKEKYISKLAEEIIRNKQLSEIILNGQVSKSSDENKYKILNENEIILYGNDLDENETLLSELYHIPQSSKKYIRFGELIKTFYSSIKKIGVDSLEKDVDEFPEEEYKEDKKATLSYLITDINYKLLEGEFKLLEKN